MTDFPFTVFIKGMYSFYHKMKFLSIPCAIKCRTIPQYKGLKMNVEVISRNAIFKKFDSLFAGVPVHRSANIVSVSNAVPK